MFGCAKFSFPSIGAWPSVAGDMLEIIKAGLNKATTMLLLGQCSRMTFDHREM